MEKSKKIRVSYILIFVAMLLVFGCFQVSARLPYTPSGSQYSSLNREDIAFDNNQVILVKYRGHVSIEKYRVAQFTYAIFLPISSPLYEFNLNFFKGTGRLVEDDFTAKLKLWWDSVVSYDTMWPNSLSKMVAEEKDWQPNQYHWTASLQKGYDIKWVSFSPENWTNISFVIVEVFMKLLLSNSNKKGMNKQIIPNQVVVQALTVGLAEGSVESKEIDVFTIGSDKMHAIVSPSIEETSIESDFEIGIPSDTTEIRYFSVKRYNPYKVPPSVYPTDIFIRTRLAEKKTRDMLNWDRNMIPRLQNGKKKIAKECCKCALFTFTNHYENPNYITDLFWAVGIWQFTVSWDTSYASDLIKMLAPNSLKDAILTDFVEVQIQYVYLRWPGAFWGNLHIKKPMAHQFIIEAYLPHTSDLSLIDVEYNTDKINEIPTADYFHTVPIANTLTEDLLYPISDWVIQRGDKKWANIYHKSAQNLEVLMEKFLWNERLG